MTKTIIFSDGLNPDKCLEIQEKFKNKIGVKFGIGGYFVNPFNLIDCVMKLVEVNGIKVYKISDDQEKSTKLYN
jgi:nicotinate phosphoribosyltransferase